MTTKTNQYQDKQDRKKALILKKFLPALNEIATQPFGLNIKLLRLIHEKMTPAKEIFSLVKARKSCLFLANVLHERQQHVEVRQRRQKEPKI